MHSFPVFFFFFSLNLFCYVFVLFCSVFFFLLIFQADTSSILFHLVVKNLILHIFLIIMIIIPCSGMFRNVLGCSMFLVLSTPFKGMVLQFFSRFGHNWGMVFVLFLRKKYFFTSVRSSTKALHDSCLSLGNSASHNGQN